MGWELEPDAPRPLCAVAPFHGAPGPAARPQPLLWDHVAAALPGDVGTPGVWDAPPLDGGFGEPKGCHRPCSHQLHPARRFWCLLCSGCSPSFRGLCPSRGLSPRLSAGIWGWGGRSGCPPLSSAGWAQSPGPRSPGGSCNAPPGFLLYHNCEALGIGREQKRAFYSSFLGVWRVCGHILPPPPRALRAPPGQQGLEMPENFPSLVPQLHGCLGSARAAR